MGAWTSRLIGLGLLALVLCGCGGNTPRVPPPIAPVPTAISAATTAAQYLVVRSYAAFCVNCTTAYWDGSWSPDVAMALDGYWAQGWKLSRVEPTMILCGYGAVCNGSYKDWIFERR